VLLAVLLLPAYAWAYRPFVSTDAAVAESKDVEIELGYFNLDRTHHGNAISTPHMVLNYGIAKNMELVGEVNLQESPDVALTDPSVSVKAVLRDGVLQDKPGMSVATEVGPLLPSTVHHERSVGFEGIGIVSGKLDPVTVHVNGGGGLDRTGELFGVWGVIGELPVHPKLRLVAEVNGQSTQGAPPNNSALLGLIWQPTAKNLFLDVGVRHGISRAAPGWQFTLGLTYGFSLPTFSRQ
jgi:hypothetical protein